jgi:hypothetical protein
MRLAFVLLTMLWGTGLVFYLVMAIMLPEARSPEEKSAVSGAPSTAQEFIRRAKEGYYEAMKGFPDRKARREWKRRFKREMRANADQWRHNWHSYCAEHAPFHPGSHLLLGGMGAREKSPHPTLRRALWAGRKAKVGRQPCADWQCRFVHTQQSQPPPVPERVGAPLLTRLVATESQDSLWYFGKARWFL